MTAAQSIRAALDQVAQLRREAATDPDLAATVQRVKRLQADRFAGTYVDLRSDGPYAVASTFFLQELYGDADFAARDAQFGRIAGAIDKLFPDAVVETAVALAELHALTEHLDHALAQRWLQHDGPAQEGRIAEADLTAYIRAWRSCSSRAERMAQLDRVLGLGNDMDGLTRKPGLRTLLRMMRRPAQASGLAALQHVLEQGFDAFAGLHRHEGGAEGFMAVVQARESEWIQRLFDAPLAECEVALATVLGLGQAR